MTANVFDLYRGTTHDGPGMRDTVFFKGCPLACKWCHNPEGISFSRQVWWEGTRCIGCGSCAQTCPQSALRAGPDGISIDPDRCVACMKCVETCPAKALQAIGRSYTPDQLAAELEKDIDYFRQFGGGVTASGGECMAQSAFVAELFARLQSRGITTAADTSGEAAYSAFRKILPHTDYILYDLKLMDAELHRQYTGADNHRILENFRQLCRDRQSGAYSFSIWVRTPLIPGATATEENIRAIARFLKPFLGTAVSRWEMCAFNNACAPKYRKLHKSWSYSELPLLSQATGNRLRSAAVEEGCDPSLVFLTGILSDR